MDNRNVLLVNLHTTPMGASRVKRNLGLLPAVDVLVWAKQCLLSAYASAWVRRGKNWYVRCDDVTFTINAAAATLITAHVTKKKVI